MQCKIGKYIVYDWDHKVYYGRNSSRYLSAYIHHIRYIQMIKIVDINGVNYIGSINGVNYIGSINLINLRVFNIVNPNIWSLEFKGIVFYNLFLSLHGSIKKSFNDIKDAKEYVDDTLDKIQKLKSFL